MGNSFSTGHSPCDDARVAHERFGPFSFLVHKTLPALSSAESVKPLVSKREKRPCFPSWPTASLSNSEQFSNAQ